jgi:hypothetical protein
MLKDDYLFVQICFQNVYKNDFMLKSILKSKKIEQISLVDLLKEFPDQHEISNVDAIEESIIMMEKFKGNFDRTKMKIILSIFLQIPKFNEENNKINGIQICVKNWISSILKTIELSLIDSYHQMNAQYGDFFVCLTVGEFFFKLFSFLEFGQKLRNKIIQKITMDDYRKWVNFKLSVECQDDDDFTSFWEKFENLILPAEQMRNLMIFYISRTLLIPIYIQNSEIRVENIENEFNFMFELLRVKNYKKIKKNLEKHFSNSILSRNESKLLFEMILRDVRVFLFLENISENSFQHLENSRNLSIQKKKKQIFEKEDKILSNLSYNGSSLPFNIKSEVQKNLWKLNRNIVMRLNILEQNYGNEKDTIISSLLYFVKRTEKSRHSNMITKVIGELISSFFIGQDYG